MVQKGMKIKSVVQVPNNRFLWIFFIFVSWKIVLYLFDIIVTFPSIVFIIICLKEKKLS